jgi:hypothetical protein
MAHIHRCGVADPVVVLCNRLLVLRAGDPDNSLPRLGIARSWDDYEFFVPSPSIGRRGFRHRNSLLQDLPIPDGPLA